MTDEEAPYWEEEFEGYSIMIQLTQKGLWHAFCYPEGQEHGTAAHVSAETKDEVTALARGKITRLLAKTERSVE